MTEFVTRAILIASALQQVFEIESNRVRDAPPERRPQMEARLRRLQTARTELLQWAETVRGTD